MARKLQTIKEGTRFNKIVVIRITDIRKHGHRQAEYRCDCGTVKTASISDIRLGRITSCGCRTASFKEIRKRHGMSDSPEYHVWAEIKQRCSNKNCRAYKNYGGRGIEMDALWSKSFNVFFVDMGERPSKKHSIERIDNDGGYNAANCVWATRTTQARNTRNNRMLTHNGEAKCLSEWAGIIGITPSSLSERIEKYGIDAAISGKWDKKQPKAKLYSYNGKTQTMTQWAIEIGVARDTLKIRLGAYGMTLERALTMKKRQRRNKDGI